MSASFPGPDCTTDFDAPFRICTRGVEFCTAIHANATPLEFALAILATTQFYELGESIWWRTDGKCAPVTYFVGCNDLFWWGSADAEELTPERLPILQAALNACGEATSEDESIGWKWGTALFCARVRGERPQGAAYPNDRRLWPLFDACGPERPKQLGNPYAPGERR